MLKENKIEKNNELFEEYINKNEEEKEEDKYLNIKNNINILKLENNKDTLIKFKKFIIDNKQLKTYISINNIINEKNIYKEDELTNKKIKLLKELKKNNDIEYLNVEYFNNPSRHDDDIVLSDELFNNIKKIYDTKIKKPNNIKTLGNLYRKMLINIYGKEILINYKKVNGYINYKLNINYINSYIELEKSRNPNYYSINYHPIIKKLLKIDTTPNNQKETIVFRPN
jgi:hypothetical protein